MDTNVEFLCSFFFSTHCSRFFGISAICPGMSAKEEKGPILFFLFSRPGGFTRISEAVCKHKHK